MNLENLIPIPQLCSHYELEMSFFVNLSEIGLLQITTVETTSYIDMDSIQKIEKIIHLHQDLEVNIEGIDVVFNFEYIKNGCLLKKLNGVYYKKDYCKTEFTLDFIYRTQLVGK